MRIRIYVMVRYLAVLVLMMSPTLEAQELLLVRGGQSELLTHRTLGNMPNVTLKTDTPWTAEPAVYTGVRLSVLADRLPSPGSISTVRLIALNDYAVNAPLNLLLDAQATLVFERNDQPMPVRYFGPFWLLFPFSERPELDTPEIRDVAVWQLQRVEFLP